jgi:hypothetical protein
MEHDYNITDSSIWLKNNYSAPKEEAILSFLQDRNFNYFSTNQICKLCNNSKNSIDHRATRCKQLLSTSYTHRHGQILKIIYLNIIKRFGFTTNNKLKFCKPVKYLENQSAKIICESKIVVDGYIKNDQPDMVVHDKKNKIITIIEVGVTNKDRLKLTEIEKRNKYLPLAKELTKTHKLPVQIAPIVISWDGLVTSHFEKYTEVLMLPKQLCSLIQKTALRETLKIMLTEKVTRIGSNNAHNLETLIDCIEVIDQTQNSIDALIINSERTVSQNENIEINLPKRITHKNNNPEVNETRKEALQGNKET